MEESKSSASEIEKEPVYLTVGDTGAGKSTFVNNLLGRPVAFAPLSNPGS
jgi:predicted GTPase